MAEPGSPHDCHSPRTMHAVSTRLLAIVWDIPSSPVLRV